MQGPAQSSDDMLSTAQPSPARHSPVQHSMALMSVLQPVMQPDTS
jgi:hypothetical protein